MPFPTGWNCISYCPLAPRVNGSFNYGSNDWHWITNQFWLQSSLFLCVRYGSTHGWCSLRIWFQATQIGIRCSDSLKNIRSKWTHDSTLIPTWVSPKLPFYPIAHPFQSTALAQQLIRPDRLILTVSSSLFYRFVLALTDYSSLPWQCLTLLLFCSYLCLVLHPSLLYNAQLYLPSARLKHFLVCSSLNSP